MELGVWNETDVSFPENEWMVWTLDMMVRASQARSKYYQYQDAQLGTLDSYDPAAIENREICRLIAVDLIFTLLRSIEAFIGALSVCWKISTEPKKVNTTKKLHQRLLKSDTNTDRKIREMFSADEIEDQTLCQLCGFPLPDGLPLDMRSKRVLWEVYDQTLKRVKLYGKYAVRYRTEFMELRNAYSHNMRLLFLEVFDTDEKNPEKGDVTGVLDKKKCRPSNLTLLCKTQREATGELTFRLCQVEQILYENLKFYVWNDCVPVPPVAALQVPSRFQEDLRRIKLELGFNWMIPAFRVEMHDNKGFDEQYDIHRSFLKRVKKLGSRE